MNSTAHDSEPQPSLLQRTLEIALLLGLFYLFAGGEPPGVNESHYLCKAKHYWNPDWCRDDLFLNSSDAHAVFYWTFGWVTLLGVGEGSITLATTAWIGRLVVWLLQAWAWRRLSWSLIPGNWYSLLSAGVFLAQLRNFHMAGEWVVGDVEAKGVAYAFVFLGMEAVVRNRWQWVFPLLGAGAAFHVIVGGWAVVAAGVAWLVMRWRPLPERDVPSLTQLLPWLLLGFVLTLPGLVPVLLIDRGAPPKLVAEGTVAYVYARLNHHLVISRFPPYYIARHVGLVAILLAVAWRMRGDLRLRPLLAFAAGAVLIEVAGVAIDQGLLYAPHELRARLLRLYWYRLGDAVVPLTLALVLTRLCVGHKTTEESGDRWGKPTRSWLGGEWLTVALLLVATGNIVEVQWRRAAHGVPEGELRLRSGGSDAPLSVAQRHHDWTACCHWIEQRTDRYATFLTPRGQQTFKWYAQRAEVVSWKDAPQDAAGLVAWLKRYEDVHPHPSGKAIMYGPELDPAIPLNARVLLLAEKYDAQYVVVDLAEEPPPLGLPHVYPQGNEFNLSFAVYRCEGE